MGKQYNNPNNNNGQTNQKGSHGPTTGNQNRKDQQGTNRTEGNRANG